MQTADLLRAAEEFLHNKIPLTQAMGVRVAQHPTGFAIEAPVALNSNHLDTAFGGSINSVATLAGYTFLWLELRGRPAYIVVGESAIRFLRPVRMTIRAFCIVPAAEQLAAFRDRLTLKGKARLELQVEVEEDGETAAAFDGTFMGVMENTPAK